MKFSDFFHGRFFCGVLLLGVFVFFAAVPARADDGRKNIGKLNGGYYLLHHTAQEEESLPLILVVKHAPHEISVFADNISRTSKETLAALERWKRSDPSLEFDRNPLPAIENDVRASIKADKQHQLLFGTTDSEFVRALLVTQIEASTYCLNIAKVLAEQEPDADRAATLRHLSAQWLARRNDAFRILRNY